MTIFIPRGYFKTQKSCTCADPFSMACPLHPLNDSDSGVRDGLRILSRIQRENTEVNGVIKSDGVKETKIHFQGPFCDCQVRFGDF